MYFTLHVYLCSRCIMRIYPELRETTSRCHPMPAPRNQLQLHLIRSLLYLCVMCYMYM